MQRSLKPFGSSDRHLESPVFFKLALSALLLASALGASARAMPCVDVALVLAIDASSSIDLHEFNFQKRATAEALRDPNVVAAIQQVGGVAVAAVIWGDRSYGPQIIDWTVITSAVEADHFARHLESRSRETAGNTDLGAGIWAALDLFETSTLCARRLVIDISADGKETLYPRRRIGPSMQNARLRAKAMGVTINGFAMTADARDLGDYFARSIISGTSAFVIEVSDQNFSSFVDGMKRKLLREIRPPEFLAQTLPMTFDLSRGPTASEPLDDR